VSCVSTATSPLASTTGSIVIADAPASVALDLALGSTYGDCGRLDPQQERCVLEIRKLPREELSFDALTVLFPFYFRMLRWSAGQACVRLKATLATTLATTLVGSLANASERRRIWDAGTAARFIAIEQRGKQRRNPKVADDDEEPGRESVERLVAENVSEAVWLRLRRLTSSILCSRIVARRASTSIESKGEETRASTSIESKGREIAWAVRSALGYWQSSAVALNAKVLTRYYALLQISIAEELASPVSKADLLAIQRRTEHGGHGLTTIVDPNGTFPFSYCIACLRNGHFYSYCKYLGLDLSQNAFERRPRNWSDLDTTEKSRLISLTDLFRRVPELQPVLDECLGVLPLSLNVHPSSKNMEEQVKRTQEHMLNTGQWVFDVPSSGETVTTYVSIDPHGAKIDQAYLNSFNLPFSNIQPAVDAVSKTTLFESEITHPKDRYWHQCVDLYKSGYSGTSFIVPFWGGISDSFVIHFTILYALSIVVRYLPSLWHEIEDGALDHIRALIEHYLTVVDNVPHLAVERITGRRLLVTPPGSLFAPG
jgi:hypothetical protein